MKLKGFSDNEEQETDDSGMAKAVAALDAILKKKREEPKKISLADLGASISIMPFSMYKRLGIGKLETINMLIEMADNTKCAPKGMVENLLIKIDKFIFPVDFVILDMAKDIRMPIILGRPLLAIVHAQVDIFRKTISLEVGSEKVIFKMRSSFNTTNFESVRSIKSKKIVEDDNLKEIDLIYSYTILNLASLTDLPINIEKHYWKSNNDSKREELKWENISLNDLMRIRYGKVCKMTKERILKDHWKERFGGEEDDLEKYLEGLEECGEDKANIMLRVIPEKLNNDWFNNTSKDKDDLEGILDYLKPRSYDGFINLDDEAYNKRRCRLFGNTYEEPTPILIKKDKVTQYTVGTGETFTKVKVLGVEKIPRTRENGKMRDQVSILAKDKGFGQEMHQSEEPKGNVGSQRKCNHNIGNEMVRFTLTYENKDYVLDKQIPTIDDDRTQEEIEATKSTMMMQTKSKGSNEHLDVVKSLMACKPKPRASICAFILEMKGYFDRLESLNMVFDAELSINIILSGLPADYNYSSYVDCWSQCKEKKDFSFQLERKGRKRKERSKRVDTQGVKESRRLKHGELNLVMGNKKITHVTRIGKYELMMKSGVRIDLNNSRRGWFLEREMISKEDSGSKIDLEEIQESADEEPIVNTNTQQEVVTPVKPIDISLPIHKTSGRISKHPQFYYGFHIEEYKICDSTLSELDEHANYKEAMASPKAAKWKEAMKSEIQCMYDNQMDVKTAFLNGKLIEDVFMAQPEGFENAKYPKRVCKLQKDIYGLKQASRSWNLYFHEKVTQFEFSRSKDESCIYVKVSGTVVVFWGAMTWKSSKQDTVEDSTCESEYIAACEALKKAIWMKNFIGDLGLAPTVQDPIEKFCDNKSAFALTKEPKDHGKSKHIERKYHFVRSKVEEGHVIVKHIRSNDILADPFTKALAKSRYDEHARSIDCQIRHSIENAATLMST
ncbi:retrotransposon protein, putative, ty1-copia subclass [Tanacetum coccineum]